MVSNVQSIISEWVLTKGGLLSLYCIQCIVSESRSLGQDVADGLIRPLRRPKSIQQWPHTLYTMQTGRRPPIHCIHSPHVLRRAIHYWLCFGLLPSLNQYSDHTQRQPLWKWHGTNLWNPNTQPTQTKNWSTWMQTSSRWKNHHDKKMPSCFSP